MVRRLLAVIIVLVLIPVPAWGGTSFAFEPHPSFEADSGDTVEIPFGVANRGATQQAVVLRMSAQNGLRFTDRFANCSYSGLGVGESVRCRFEQPFEAGAFYRTSSPVSVVVDDDSWGGLMYDWCTPGTYLCEVTGAPGDGPPLTLVPGTEPGGLRAGPGDGLTVLIDQGWSVWTWWPFAVLVLMVGGAVWLVFWRRKGQRGTRPAR